MNNRQISNLARKYRESTPNQMAVEELAFIAGFNAAKEIYNPTKTKTKTEELLEVGWVNFKEEKPTINSFYSTKIIGSDEIISDWWEGKRFVFNNEIITQWKKS
jgi:hypothetical protein